MGWGVVPPRGEESRRGVIQYRTAPVPNFVDNTFHSAIMLHDSSVSNINNNTQPNLKSRNKCVEKLVVKV